MAAKAAVAARSSLAGPDPGWCVSLDQHPPAPCWGSTGMLSSTVHPTDPHHHHGDPLAAQGGGGPQSWPHRGPYLCLFLFAPQLKSVLGTGPAPKCPHPGREERELPPRLPAMGWLSSGSLSPPFPSQPGTLPGPQLHSQERQGSHADHSYEQSGQDGEGQEVGESCGQRGDRADPRWHRGCRLSKTGGGSGSPDGAGGGGGGLPQPFSPWL